MYGKPKHTFTVPAKRNISKVKELSVAQKLNMEQIIETIGLDAISSETFTNVEMLRDKDDNYNGIILEAGDKALSFQTSRTANVFNVEFISASTREVIGRIPESIAGLQAVAGAQGLYSVDAKEYAQVMKWFEDMCIYEMSDTVKERIQHNVSSIVK
ncbi:MAG: hypothetical protein ACK4NC_05635 [Candidatus Gracilibacteria bacterium]